LPEWTVELLDADDDYPPESAETYEENALGKARYGRAHASPDAWVAGEDSGIEVAALGGRPGVHSARWADDPIAALLAELDGVTDRRARFVCAIVALAPAGDPVYAVGMVEGQISDEARGTGGFGYDPIFVPDGQVLTMAELGDDWKRLNSHRARAAAAFREALA
jgi:XTP/dITP diphosphohydrolase